MNLAGITACICPLPLRCDAGRQIDVHIVTSGFCLKGTALLKGGLSSGRIGTGKDGGINPPPEGFGLCRNSICSRQKD
jgi:hypothetical protein